MFGIDVVVLNSSETIADLLDKRSAIYSDKVPTLYRVYSARANTTAYPFPTTAPNTDSGVDRSE